MTTVHIGPAAPRRFAAHRLPRVAALGLALGLYTLAPCCPAPAPAAQPDPGVTVTEPTAPPDGADGEAVQGVASETSGVELDGAAAPTDGGVADDGGAAAEEAQSRTGDGGPSAGAETGESPDEGTEEADAGTAAAEGLEGIGVARALDAAAAADLEGTPYGPDMTGAEETGLPVAGGASADPMEVLLAVVRQRQAEGFPVTVEMADPATGRVVYGEPDA